MSNEIPRKKLAYYAPMRERKRKIKWRVPQSHSLHICPSACSRRNVISAMRSGDHKHISCLYITEADVVSGNYENIVGDAIADLLEVLVPSPRVFLLYFKCIDDFLATDENALLQRLHSRFPEIKFACCHIDPVAMGGKIMPGMLIQSRMYTFLEKTHIRDNGVNLIGSFVPFDPACEIYDLFKAFDIGPMRSLFISQTYDDYQEMAKSRFNMVTSRMGEFAANELEKKLGTPYCYCPAVFDPDAIIDNYSKISRLLNKDCPDFSKEREQGIQEIILTKNTLGNMPIIIDSVLPSRVFSFAKLLLTYEFNVQLIFATHVFDVDRDDFDWIKKHHPEVRIERSDNFENILGYGIDPNSLAIGYECASILRTDHYVDLWDQEGLYGFYGLHKLMQMMREAITVKANWKDLTMPGKA